MLDFRLIYDGKAWRAMHGDISVQGKSLISLDKNLEQELVNRDMTQGLSEYKVRMTFDNSCMPEFMRQYANHYFNRVVHFKFDNARRS
ncbi:MAG: DUF5395 family protein [Desulfoplanes sp.]|nr:DUF5395 family protein [Desulfoplanes sp.]